MSSSGQLPITLEFLIILVTVAGGGGGIVIWLTQQFSALRKGSDAMAAKLKSDIDAQFADLRKERSEETVRVSEKIDQLSRSLAEHKLEVSKEYMSKTSFLITTEKISKDLERMDTKIDQRLARIEDRLEGQSRS